MLSYINKYAHESETKSCVKSISIVMQSPFHVNGNLQLLLVLVHYQNNICRFFHAYN